MQPPDCLHEGVLGHPRQVQARFLRGLKDFPADVQAGRHLSFVHVICRHVISCGLGYLLPPEGNAEAAAIRRFGRWLCPGPPPTSFNASARYSFFESIIEVPRIKHGNRQTIEPLVNEEALLFASYLRNERETWVPRVVTLAQVMLN